MTQKARAWCIFGGKALVNIFWILGFFMEVMPGEAHSVSSRVAPRMGPAPPLRFL